MGIFDCFFDISDPCDQKKQILALIFMLFVDFEQIWWEKKSLKLFLQ
jgi:hypothetical protein